MKREKKYCPDMVWRSVRGWERPMAKIWTITDKTTESNCYLIEENKKVIVIDPNDAEGIITVMEKCQWKAEKIFLTHEHCDHTQGLNTLRAYCKVPVIAQEKCSEGIQDSVRNMSRRMGVYLFYKYKKDMEDYQAFVCKRAESTFQKDMCWTFQGHELQAISLPGHTPGSSCLILDRTRLFSGDYLLPGEETVTRFPGGSMEDYEKKTKPWLRKLSMGMRVYPGHGFSFRLNEEVMRQHGL